MQRRRIEEAAELNLMIQKHIEMDRKKKQELENQWILHGGEMPRIS
jgi:hypothetical protein